jgi:hypothetical protein
LGEPSQHPTVRPGQNKFNYNLELNKNLME